MQRKEVPQAKDISTVRILLLGDSGVGKTKLANLLSPDMPKSKIPVSAENWCNVTVRLHEYPINAKNMPPTPDWSPHSSCTWESFEHQAEYFPRKRVGTEKRFCFIEFYDMNSAISTTPLQRNRLYRHMDGIILVYDLMDMTTHDNLYDWMYKPLRQIYRCRHKYREERVNFSVGRRSSVPILVVGTKSDLQAKRRLRRKGGIANMCSAEEVLINCLDTKCLDERTRNGNKVENFFNKVIEFKQNFLDFSPQAPL